MPYGNGTNDPPHGDDAFTWQATARRGSGVLIRAAGATELLASYQPGDGEPWPFYERFGFRPTGELDGTEVALHLSV
jgi:hypothetical protein